LALLVVGSALAIDEQSVQRAVTLALVHADGEVAGASDARRPLLQPVDIGGVELVEGRLEHFQLLIFFLIEKDFLSIYLCYF
jgi:hypothetical protein